MAQPGPDREVRAPVLDRRRAGVLLHLSSLLSGSGAAGALGDRARAFVDWLAAAGFSVWQVLPVGPTGPDGSPYWARSDYAGNPLLLGSEGGAGGGADAESVATAAAVDAFHERSAYWLDDYSLFTALGEAQPGLPWWQWPDALRERDPDALRAARARYAPRIAQVVLEQFRFELEWLRLRSHAHARGVRLFGDLPIYLSPDSCDVWAHRAEFQLGADGRPLAVAGVPPDYFSATGQLWGNPLYDWAQGERSGFAFWRSRIARQLERFDLLRIDHFRGLAAYWAVPADAEDARGGNWQQAPGEALLRAVREDFPDLPLVAEDLGVITPDVEALRSGFGLPGMRVLQFGFGGDAASVHLPHNYGRDCVAYTGTHDNDTTLGWYASLDAGALRRVNDYLRVGRGEMPEAAVRATLGSVAALAIIPAQDLLGLDSGARLNTPGTVERNWRWRLEEGLLSEDLARRFARLNGMFGR